MVGPPPNRPNDLSRKRDAERGGNQWAKGTLRPVTLPQGDPNWDAVVTRMWDSLSTSGMADFYQDTDWAYAYIVLDELAVYRRKAIDKATGEPYPTHKPSGQMFQALMAAMTSLGLTEGERRRMRIELEEPQDDQKPAEVTAIEGYKARMQRK